MEKVNLNKTAIAKILTPWSPSPNQRFSKPSAVNQALGILKGYPGNPDSLMLTSTCYNKALKQYHTYIWFVDRSTQTIKLVTEHGYVVKGWDFS